MARTRDQFAPRFRCSTTRALTPPWPPAWQRPRPRLQRRRPLRSYTKLPRTMQVRICTPSLHTHVHGANVNSGLFELAVKSAVGADPGARNNAEIEEDGPGSGNRTRPKPATKSNRAVCVYIYIHTFLYVLGAYVCV